MTKIAVFPEPTPENSYLSEHIERLRYSYQRWLGRPLLDATLPPPDAAQQLFYAPFALISHSADADPIFTYGNQTAQRLFEVDWAELTKLPSRLSAEPPNRDERAALLFQVAQHGFAEGYAGVRISKTGKRFRIENVTVWNIMDATETYYGQAAMYNQWVYL